MNITEEFTKRRRKISDEVLNPLTELLFKFRVKPNSVSLSSAIILILSSYLIFINLYNYAIVLILFSIILDLLDGALARKYKFNEYGFLFDSLTDYCFASLLVIALYAVSFISFEITLLTVSSNFFYNIFYIYYILIKKKTPFTIPVGIHYVIIASLLFPLTAPFLITLLFLLNTIQGVVLLRSM